VSEPDGELLVLRNRLGDLDQRIVELIAERFRVVADVATEKAASDAAIRDSDRERQVLAAVEHIARTEGAPVNLVRRIYRDLLAESVSRQVSSRSGVQREVALRVAVRGEQSFGFLAAQKYLSTRDVDGDLVVTRTYQAAVEALKAGEVDLAVLPIENTAAGSIDDTYDLLRENEVSIVGEETSGVDYCLCGVSDIPLGAISQVLAGALELGARDGLDPTAHDFEGAVAEWRRTVWAAVGVLSGELTSPVLCLNIPGDPTTAAGRALAIWMEAGQPLHLTVRQLLRHPPSFPGLRDRVVYVCENPTVVAEAANALGPRSAPLVCCSGHPAGAATAA